MPEQVVSMEAPPRNPQVPNAAKHQTDNPEVLCPCLTSGTSVIHGGPTMDQTCYTVPQYLTPKNLKKKKSSRRCDSFFFFLFFFTVTLPENLTFRPSSEFQWQNTSHPECKTLSRCLLRLCNVYGGWWIKTSLRSRLKWDFSAAVWANWAQVLGPTSNFERDWRKF